MVVARGAAGAKQSLDMLVVCWDGVYAGVRASDGKRIGRVGDVGRVGVI